MSNVLGRLIWWLFPYKGTAFKTLAVRFSHVFLLKQNCCRLFAAQLGPELHVLVMSTRSWPIIFNTFVCLPETGIPALKLESNSRNGWTRSVQRGRLNGKIKRKSCAHRNTNPLCLPHRCLYKKSFLSTTSVKYELEHAEKREAPQETTSQQYSYEWLGFRPQSRTALFSMINNTARKCCYVSFI